MTVNLVSTLSRLLVVHKRLVSIHRTVDTGTSYLLLEESVSPRRPEGPVAYPSVNRQFLYHTNPSSLFSTRRRGTVDLTQTAR